jgi:hypothetical protein
MVTTTMNCNRVRHLLSLANAWGWGSCRGRQQIELRKRRPAAPSRKTLLFDSNACLRILVEGVEGYAVVTPDAS